MIARFLTALQFLSVLPIRLTKPANLSEAGLYFPVVGGLLGATAGALLLLLKDGLGMGIASIAGLTLLLLLTGGLHEDGLADVADACRAGRSRETIFRILKDSRIGTYGALALIATLLFRWESLSSYRLNPVLGLVAALALSRTSLVVLAGLCPAAGEGLGAEFSRGLSRKRVLLTGVVGAFIAIAAAQWAGLVMIAFTVLVIASARSYFLRRIGGVNGDCLGATCQIVEVLNLLVMAWQPSI